MQPLPARMGVFAPLVVSPLMAKLAQEAGFAAGYVGGGALGFLNACTEANLGLTEMAQLGLAIRAASTLPLILDGVCGWGDPMHMRHTIGTAEAAGFAAIEIEDQLLPKRAHHHIGIEHIIPTELMAAKIREAVATRRNPDFLVIARTNAARSVGLDEALRRGEALHAAGADVLLRYAGEAGPSGHHSRAPAPAAHVHAADRRHRRDRDDRRGSLALGFTLVVDPGTPLFAMVRRYGTPTVRCATSCRSLGRCGRDRGGAAHPRHHRIAGSARHRAAYCRTGTMIPPGAAWRACRLA